MAARRVAWSRPEIADGGSVGHEEQSQRPDAWQRVRHAADVGDDLGRVHEGGFRGGVRLEFVGLAQEREQPGERLLVGLASGQRDAVDLDPELEPLLGGLFKLKAFDDHRGAERDLLQL